MSFYTPVLMPLLTDSDSSLPASDGWSRYWLQEDAGTNRWRPRSNECRLLVIKFKFPATFYFIFPILIEGHFQASFTKFITEAQAYGARSKHLNTGYEPKYSSIISFSWTSQQPGLYYEKA